MSSSPDKSKLHHQLRARIPAEDFAFLEKLQKERGRGESISELVREGIQLLAHKYQATVSPPLSPEIKAKLEALARLLQREPHQVEEACILGIFDLIEDRAKVPLIVMETQLHLNYPGQEEKPVYPWKKPAEEA